MPDDSLYSLDDTALLLRLGGGSRQAFDVLYNRYWKAVFNTAYKRLNDEQQAQDIAQDVFVQLWLRGSKSPIENLQAYLHIAARNGVFKFFEKQGRLAILPDTPEDLEDEYGNADSGVLHQEFLTAFNALVEALPAQQRLIFKMRFEEELSSQQIAEKLGLSPKTVRNQLGRALSTLKTSMLIFQFFFLLYSGK